MLIDWMHFTPWQSAIGGLLLGLAAGMFILLNGRVLGISGIIGGLFAPKPGDASWRLTFLLGMAAAPALFVALAPNDLISMPRIEAGNVQIVLAGLLVGFGTRYGSGCTSGHGVCGLSRLSLRSFMATLCFMGAGFLTVFVSRHLF